MPELLKPTPSKNVQQSKKSKQKVSEEISWDFDSKEHAREKYGNFNTPIMIKLASKYNKNLSASIPEVVVAENHP